MIRALQKKQNLLRLRLEIGVFNMKIYILKETLMEYYLLILLPMKYTLRRYVKKMFSGKKYTEGKAIFISAISP